MTRVLVVDDDEQLCKLMTACLTARGFQCSACPSAERALELIHDSDYDVIVTDLCLGGLSGLDLCTQSSASRPDIPVLVVTAHGSLDTAVAALRAGAYDFVSKPIDQEILAAAVRRAAENRSLQKTIHRLRQAIPTAKVHGLIGESPAMAQLFSLIERVAALELPVLISGESGTGKELVARALHGGGPRPKAPFIAVNCAALPENLLESELFGHVRGAFTDARTDRSGLLVRAGTGTLFLDELGELPLRLQPKLLRALQEHTVRPVGGDKEITWSARVIAATNRDLEVAVAHGEFREDLYYRLNVVGLRIPPLRERGADVALCAQHFLEEFARNLGKDVRGFSAAALHCFNGYLWPGNVRELQNCVQRAVALTQFDHIVVEDLPEKMRTCLPANPQLARTTVDQVSLAEQEKGYILRVLEGAGGNKTEAAKILGIERRTLYRKLAQYAVSDPSSNESF